MVAISTMIFAESAIPMSSFSMEAVEVRGEPFEEVRRGVLVTKTPDQHDK